MHQYFSLSPSISVLAHLLSFYHYLFTSSLNSILTVQPYFHISISVCPSLCILFVFIFLDISSTSSLLRIRSFLILPFFFVPGSRASFSVSYCSFHLIVIGHIIHSINHSSSVTVFPFITCSTLLYQSLPVT